MVNNKDVLKINFDENEDIFTMDLNKDVYQEEYLDNFTNPTKPRKNLAEYRKVNTKIDIELHRLLKTYCAENDLKKNEVFNELLELFCENYEGVIDIKHLDTAYISKDKKPFNFELPVDFSRQVKVLAAKNNILLADVYEQAIAQYLRGKNVIKKNS